MTDLYAMLSNRSIPKYVWNASFNGTGSKDTLERDLLRRVLDVLAGELLYDVEIA